LLSIQVGEISGSKASRGPAVAMPKAGKLPAKYDHHEVVRLFLNLTNPFGSDGRSCARRFFMPEPMQINVPPSASLWLSMTFDHWRNRLRVKELEEHPNRGS
jgi:hypothetical protein